MSRISPTRVPLTEPESAARSEMLSHNLKRIKEGSLLDFTIDGARDALLELQSAEGHWLFELEADCPISAQSILMMHFLAEIDVALEAKICEYLRARQAEHGGWPLYHDG